MIKINDKALMKGLAKIEKGSMDASRQSLKEMGDTLLILSRYEVPHDEGILQASGFVGFDGDDVFVAYNTEYAAYQHEGIRKDGSHKIRNYQKGRKKKFLEDPLKMNISRWQEIARDNLLKELK